MMIAEIALVLSLFGVLLGHNSETERGRLATEICLFVALIAMACIVVPPLEG